ncbi:MAG: NfeD family protein [Christensenellales bacterium]|jgi:membrane-bound ClpP family serine protease
MSEFFAYIGAMEWYVFALIIIGIVLIAVEMIQPGIGIAGVLGTTSLIVAIFLQAKTFFEAIIMLAVLFCIIGVLFLIFARSIYKGRFFQKRLMLQDQAETIDTKRQHQDLVGKKGIVITMLRPVGTVDFDGEHHQVVSRGEYIEKGQQVEVLETDGLSIVVKKTEDE